MMTTPPTEAASPAPATFAPVDAGSPSKSQGSPQQRLTLAYWLSGALAIVALIASSVGVFFPTIFRDPAMTAGNARGTAVVILAVAIPTLLVSLFLAPRGSLRAQLVWMGALFYLLYNAVFFAFDAAFNPLFLFYIAVLSLAVWALVALLLGIDAQEIRAHFDSHVPIRAIAGYLLVTTALFASTWLRDIVPALVNNTTPASLAGTIMLTNPIQVMDFAFGFPLTVLAAIWLWQRRAWGYVLAGAFLVYGVIEVASVATDQVFGHLSDPTQSLAMVPVFVALTLIGLIPTIVFLRGLQPRTEERTQEKPS
jgi:hypothetical protein